ncbi:MULTISPECIES: glycosyltransferase family 4 protein [unclassified Afipia]|uniref:glycosyltransferase family 4 protein n=1 Tax=unclassified Afipia TaxID=2642050 RepID=UPI000465F9C9|nr:MULTISPECIES: glycosyltransferase family 4 protein [unclassified Afipia]
MIGFSKVRGRILIVDHSTPKPDQDSGSASTFSYLQILARSGYKVTFAPFDLQKAGRYTRALQQLGIEALSSPKWPSIYDIIETLGPRHDIILFYRAHVAVHLFDLARNAAPNTKILFHPVDLHFLRMEREAALSNDPSQIRSAGEMRVTELDLIQRADATIVVSTYERELLKTLAPGAPVHQIPILRETPSVRSAVSGIGWFGNQWAKLRGKKPQSASSIAGFDDRRDILFIGGFGHTPNVDAVLWFAREVWPHLLAKGFRERLVIVGSKIPSEISDLASDSIDVRGYVKDLQPLFAGCRLSIAPLRFGGGIKGKIVTSLSYGVPVVATKIAAEGMQLVHNENILIADSPIDMADQILAACSDPVLWQKLSSNGHAAFASQFSHTAGKDRVLAVIEGLITAPLKNAPAREINTDRAS